VIGTALSSGALRTDYSPVMDDLDFVLAFSFLSFLSIAFAFASFYEALLIETILTALARLEFVF